MLKTLIKSQSGGKTVRRVHQSKEYQGKKERSPWKKKPGKNRIKGLVPPDLEDLQVILNTEDRAYVRF